MSISLPQDCNMDKFNTLVCIDGSYVIYHTLFSAVNEWSKESSNAFVLEEVDVSNDNFTQVDIVRFDDFIEILRSKFINTFLKINRLVNDYNLATCSKTSGDFIFVLDPEHGKKSRSWRYFIYPEYKGQRAASRDKKPYEIFPIFKKLIELVRTDPIIVSKFHPRVVSADNAEADDIIATIFEDEANTTYNKFLIASDKDYLQLENVTQMTLEGKPVEIEQPYPSLINVTPSQYLLAKILTGDPSDNITQVFDRVGYKTAIKKYVANPQYLTESLENDAVALQKFNRNSKLIDFHKIPKKIRAIARNAIAQC